jgi:hypothetical protein
MTNQDIEDFLEIHISPALDQLVDEAYCEQYTGWARRKSTVQLKSEIRQMVANQLKKKSENVSSPGHSE